MDTEIQHSIIGRHFKKIIDHGKAVRFDLRRHSIVVIDDETNVIVTQIELRKGADGRDVLKLLIGALTYEGAKHDVMDGLASEDAKG
jgi:hypothetical protein